MRAKGPAQSRLGDRRATYLFSGWPELRWSSSFSLFRRRTIWLDTLKRELQGRDRLNTYRTTPQARARSDPQAPTARNNPQIRWHPASISRPVERAFSACHRWSKCPARWAGLVW